MTRDDIAHLMNDTAPRLSGWGTEAHFQNFAQALMKLGHEAHSMTRDDIISMAREAGLLPGEYTGGLEVFAALVISHHVKETRPEVSDSMEKWLQQIAYQHGGIGDLSKTEMEFGAMVAAAEREACAKAVERARLHMDGSLGLTDETDFIATRITDFLAAQIRASGR